MKDSTLMVRMRMGIPRTVKVMPNVKHVVFWGGRRSDKPKQINLCGSMLQRPTELLIWAKNYPHLNLKQRNYKWEQSKLSGNHATEIENMRTSCYVHTETKKKYHFHEELHGMGIRDDARDQMQTGFVHQMD